MQSFERQPLRCGTWLECCKSNDELRKSGLLDHLRAFRIDNHIYEAVINKNLALLDLFRGRCGDFNDDNYCDVMRTVSRVDEAYNAISMRQFDVSKKQITIQHLEDEVTYLEVLVERLSKVKPSLVEKDIVILSADCTANILEGEVESVDGNKVRIAFGYHEKKFAKHY
jgi:hypothetical protein